MKSVSIKCADPETPAANDTSYVYGTNTSTDTPSIAFSNASVMVDGTPTLSVPFSSTLWLAVAGLLAVAALF